MYTSVHDSTSINLYQNLREQILHLTLAPGTIVSEIDTAAKYATSRTPVRDAFKMLEGEGLLTIRPHVGTFVTPIDLDMLSNILYVRNALEQAVLKDLSIARPQQEFQINLLLTQQEELLKTEPFTEETGRAFIISDDEFHQYLFTLGGKDRVYELFSPLNNQYERFRMFLNLYMPENMQTLCDQHRRIWESITSQDFDALSDLIYHHIYDGFNASSQLVYEHPEYFQNVG